MGLPRLMWFIVRTEQLGKIGRLRRNAACLLAVVLHSADGAESEEVAALSKLLQHYPQAPKPLPKPVITQRVSSAGAPHGVHAQPHFCGRTTKAHVYQSPLKSVIVSLYSNSGLTVQQNWCTQACTRSFFSMLTGPPGSLTSLTPPRVWCAGSSKVVTPSSAKASARHSYTPDAVKFRAAMASKDTLPVLKRTGSSAVSSR